VGSPATVSRPDGEVGWLKRDVLLVRFDGHVTGMQVVSLSARVTKLVGSERPRRCLIDTSSVTGYSVDVRTPGREFLHRLRDIGVERTAVAVANPLVRMMGSAIAVAAGFPLIFVDSLDEATRLLDDGAG
jgi:hypothetical protein